MVVEGEPNPRVAWLTRWLEDEGHRVRTVTELPAPGDHPDPVYLALFAVDALTARSATARTAVKRLVESGPDGRMHVLGWWRTVDRLRNVPVASELIIHARQELVKRLDGYELDQPELFAQVVEFVSRKIMPIVQRHAISGVAHINTEDPLLDDAAALAMLIDIFSERGYHAVVDLHRIEVPEKIDLTTGQVACRVKKVFRIVIRFQGSEIRRG